MSQFLIGDIVTDGTRTGVVSEGFYWKDSDDGSMNEPRIGFVPIIWDNDTQGYHADSELQYT